MSKRRFKKKDQKDPVPKEKGWEQPKKKRRFKFSFPKLRFPRLRKPTIKKYRVPLLLQFKRFLAAILFIMNVSTGLAMIQTTAAWFFLLSSFILLDYLWKTRKRFLWKE